MPASVLQPTEELSGAETFGEGDASGPAVELRQCKGAELVSDFRFTRGSNPEAMAVKRQDTRSMAKAVWPIAFSKETFAETGGNEEDAPIPAYSLNRDRIAKPDPHASSIRGCADGRSGRLKPVTLIELTSPRRSPVQSRYRAAPIPYSAFACLAGWRLRYLIDDR